MTFETHFILEVKRSKIKVTSPKNLIANVDHCTLVSAGFFYLH